MGKKMKAFGAAIWKGLGEKGKFATIIGLLFALPVNIRFIIAFFNGVEYSRESLINLAVMNCIAMVWFILPSRVTIRAGEKFEITVED